MAQHRRGPGDNRRTGRTSPRSTSRRSSGARSPASDLSKAIGGLLRSTLEQVGAVGEVALERARGSRGRLDGVMLERKRRDALARLGEAVYIMAVRGRLGGLADAPEIAELLADVEDLEERLDEQRFESEGDADFVSSADWRPPAPRDRDRDEDSMRVWRPVVPKHDPESASTAGTDNEAQRTAPAEPPVRASAERSTGSRERRRESATPAPFDARAEDSSESEPTGLAALAGLAGLGDLAQLATQVIREPRPATPHPEPARSQKPSPTRGRRGRGRRARANPSESSARGGIAFISDEIADDEDLAEYMHEDDLPTDLAPDLSNDVTDPLKDPHKDPLTGDGGRSE